MKVEITYRIALQDSGNPASLWIPVPANIAYQSVPNRRHEGNYAQARFYSAPLYGAPALYARWDKGTDSKALTVTTEVEVRERRVLPVQAGRWGELPADVRHFLEPTAHIPIDGIVKQRAEEVVAGRSGPLDKAKAIYDWIIENTHRDFKVAWCGLGDVKTMLESGNLCGKCVDINSLVVALARAA
ncbi:MAG: transglutaminase family protein, partial [Gammaproteobacteria bacterium]|nr:transglutaminase family protein [Gammaproteobacteria bacterium]